MRTARILSTILVLLLYAAAVIYFSWANSEATPLVIDNFFVVFGIAIELILACTAVGLGAIYLIHRIYK